MKRLFVILSNILASIFLVWVFTTWADTYVSFLYPNVAVFETSDKVRFDKLAERLDKLAKDSNSLIAIQHQEPDENGVPVFSYTTFGQGKLPENLKQKSLEESKNAALATNYFIFSGRARLGDLTQVLSEQGLRRLNASTPNHLALLASLMTNRFQIIALSMFCLTFGALSLIGHIRALRTAGIRLIAGESRWKLFGRTLTKDLQNGILGVATGLFLAVILKSIVFLPWLVFVTIALGLLVYNFLLLLISLFFAGLFATGIRKVPLMQVIKGKVPVGGIISLILLGQMLALVMVAVSLHHSVMYVRSWQATQSVQKFWQKEPQLTALGLGRGALSGDKHHEQVWYQLLNQAVSEQDGLLVYHHLYERVRDWQTAKTGVSGDYSPDGNVLIVTPNYLKHQGVKVSEPVEQKLRHLTKGHFVLLLPNSLRSQTNHYKATFEEELTNLMSSEKQMQKMKATVSYVATGQERFVYNTSLAGYEPLLKDPIIAVVTPQSTGDQSLHFWTNALQGYFYFDNIRHAQELAASYGMQNFIADYNTGFKLYNQSLAEAKREIWTAILGAILGLVTALLMFNTMNQLYFSEFRREIFIKRIAGLRFLEIHRSYLLAQLLVFMLASVVAAFMTTNILMVALVFGVFLLISLGQLALQMHWENQRAMLILKGA